MIGGTDSVFKISKKNANDSLMSNLLEICSKQWKKSVLHYDFENNKYAEFFVYKTQKAAEMWKELGLTSQTKSKMIHILFNKEDCSLTLVHDSNCKLVKSLKRKLRGVGKYVN